MTEAALGVGVVGCGAIGLRRATVAASHPASRVVAVADLEPARAREAAEAAGAQTLAGWREVVRHPEVDVVIVATTHDWLAPISIAALEAGKHVLCEKPMAAGSREAGELVAAVRRTGRFLKVGFNHREHPAIRQAHDLAVRGEVGDIYFIRCRYGHGGRPGYEREWRMDPERSGGGELLDQGIHAIDLFRWFLGDLSEATGITATWEWRAPVEDNVFALFRTPQGQVASLHASWTQWKNLFSFEVVGARGALLVEGLGKSYGTERLTMQRRIPSGPPEEERLEFPEPDRSWDREWEDFVAAIRGAGAPAVGAEDGLAALRLVEAVYESARSGATVRLETPVGVTER
ncbi:MAG: Gfo/Idh/MocA family oxidoreductase [Candidatus Rokubacteria bacterium]|nr:Gfo/Idh/MocA family oxidoreductase [Candidatus Rokubacteria bacterium]